jgi:BirA family transcriptional regulator, biotin operon repressor / biotin---[acetyl-CoA-carboxylase] ligase
MAHPKKIKIENKLLPTGLDFFDLLESTNDYLEALPPAEQVKYIIASREQSGGKGRQGRKWQSGYDKGLWFSFYLNWNRKGQTHLLIFAIALAIRAFLIENGIEENRILLKWPNDVLIDKKKICGILLKTRILNNNISGLIVGIGLNVNYVREDFIPEFSENVTSLRMIDGKKRDIYELLLFAIHSLDQYLYMQHDNDYCNIMKKWREASMKKGDNIYINRLGKEPQAAEYVDVDSDGALIVSIDGREERILSADVGV